MTAAIEVTGPVFQAHQLLVQERRRLEVEEGLTDTAADKLVDNQLHTAAQCYLLSTDHRPGGKPWPSIGIAWRPGDRLVHLARAGALYLAEAERLERARKPAAARLRRASLAIAEGLSKHLARQAVPAQREDHRP